MYVCFIILSRFTFVTKETRSKIVKNIHFSLFPRPSCLESTGVFSKKNSIFFETFLQSQLVIFMKKVTFWKMKKILSKIFKKARFFAHLRAERSKCQPPIFEGPLFEHFHKVNDENQGVWKIGIKGYPLYIQTFWTLFWPLFEGYSSNP